MLLRSEQALIDSGIQLPPNVTVARVNPEALEGVDPSQAPIVLVKTSFSGEM
jgi:hypothetical protein